MIKVGRALIFDFIYLIAMQHTSKVGMVSIQWPVSLDMLDT